MESSLAVLGAGYVGLTTAVCLASLGHSVVVSDTDEKKLRALSEGICPIFEESLQELLIQNLEEERLRFVKNNSEAARCSEFTFLCLPTPESISGEADMRFVYGVLTEIRHALQPGAVLITKSTVPVGASIAISNFLNRDDIYLVSNPEFLREGSAVKDFLKPDRIVIGSNSKKASSLVRGLYSKVSAPVIETDPTSAESIKYASNAFLATKLSFVNEIADLCELLGADANQVLEGMGLDSRIGSNYLRQGPGWGGSCFPKDTKALIATAKNKGMDLDLLQSAVDANNTHIQRIASRINSLDNHNRASRVVAVLGLAFKAGTDDLRSSPAIEISKRLVQMGNKVQAYDPACSGRASVEFGDGIELCTSPEEAANGSDLIAVLTEWPEFNELDPGSLGKVMKRKIVFDGRSMLDRPKWVEGGFAHYCVGLSLHDRNVQVDS